MEKSIKEKFDNIIVGRIPSHYQYELENIVDDTDNFAAPKEIINAWADGFNYIYAVIEKKYPTALKDYVAPEPSAEELKAAQDKADFDKSIELGDGCFSAKDFEGARIHYTAALELKINDGFAEQKISESEKEIASAAALKAKQDKIEKAREIASKHKKPSANPA